MSARRLRTAGEASLLLLKYEALNADLPRETRRQLAIFVLVNRVGKAALEELFDRPLGQTPRRHRAWLWYNAIRLSGLEKFWDEFQELYNSGVCLHCCLAWLKEQASPEEWALLSRRMGVSLEFGKGGTSLNPHWWKHTEHKQRNEIWTKGGTWDRRNNFTRVLVSHEHLTRDHDYNDVTRVLSQGDCKQLEIELRNLCNPEYMLVPQAIVGAVEYARRRIPTLLGYKRKYSSYKTVSWFFQCKVPHPDGGFVLWTRPINYPMRESDGYDLTWLPKK